VTQTETRIFHYDLRGHLIGETNQSGQMLAEYVYLGDQLLVMIKPGEAVYYFHNDHLGTPQVLTDDSQTIAWKAVYTPFGEAVASVQTIDSPFRFPGQYYDQETGLHYNYFRYYNPQIGRYITPDPIGLEGGINLFAYVDNPINVIDPLGLFDIQIADNGGKKGPTYGGIMRVEGDNGKVTYVEVSIWPNPTRPEPGIASGEFNSIYSTTGHKGVTNGVRLEDGKPIPTIGPNPGNNNQMTATGVNIHCGDTQTNRGSTNCITIRPDQCQQVWDVLQEGEKGKVDVSRSTIKKLWLRIRRAL
jgi:RHS repeat-associated protein